ncbi:MAG: hypothetical protein U0T77_06695 [Chitinophagales bacterium]
MTIDFIDKVELVLGKIKDEELLLLKGHLFIEELISETLKKQFGEDTVNKLRLSFENKFILFCSITGLKKDSEQYQSIIKINQMRNKLAHRLDISLKKDFIELIKIYNDYIPKTINRKLTFLNSIKKIFFGLLAYLHGYTRAQLMIKDRNKYILSKKHPELENEFWDSYEM